MCVWSVSYETELLLDSKVFMHSRCTCKKSITTAPVFVISLLLTQDSGSHKLLHVYSLVYSIVLYTLSYNKCQQGNTVPGVYMTIWG